MTERREEGNGGEGGGDRIHTFEFDIVSTLHHQYVLRGHITIQ